MVQNPKVPFSQGQPADRCAALLLVRKSHLTRWMDTVFDDSGEKIIPRIHTPKFRSPMYTQKLLANTKVLVVVHAQRLPG